jgi:DNA helicase-2/ATP-dependent DNA helicase PcrA
MGKSGYDETGRRRGPGGGFSETGAPRYGERGRAGEDGPGDDSLDYAQPDYDDDSPAPKARPPGRGAKRAGVGVPLIIEGELVAKSTGTVSDFTVGDRVFHQKFGNGNVVVVDGNKLTIAFDKAGEKRVVDSFVERV